MTFQKVTRAISCYACTLPCMCNPHFLFQIFCFYHNSGIVHQRHKISTRFSLMIRFSKPKQYDRNPLLRMSRPKKRKTTGNQPEIKLPMALIGITCPDKGCMKCFKTERGLASHFDKSPGCAQAITKVLQSLPTQT